MSAQNNQITAPRVDLIDQNGKISREWYMYLYNLYVITGSGTGITPVINGGTGLGTIPTNGQLLIGNGTGYTLNTLANGAGISITDGSGTILISNTGVLSTIAGTGISVSSATGDVTIANTGVLSVTGTAPVVSSGGANPAISLATAYGDTLNPYAAKTANYVLAGPTTGAAAAPTFRALTTTDIPVLPYGTGTVTSVGMTVPAALLSVAPSTITTTGTFALSLTTQTSAQIFASPISTVGTPSFRSLVTSDIPALNYVSSTTTQAAHQVLAGPRTGTSAPTFRSLVSTDIPALPYNTGSVTSVGLALPSSIFSISNSPVTTTGTLTGTLTTQAANSLFAGPISGVGATPTFRALTTADIAGLGVGTVTSVGMTVPSILSVTPSTITTSGSFALSLTTEPANQIFAGPSSGSAATPTFRSLVSTDIPALPYVTTSAIVTKTADFTLASTENWVINNKSGSTCTVTLPAASSWSGRAVTFKNLQAQTLVSASSNVVPIDSTTAGTAILLASIGNWATIVSDSTNWVIMQAAPNNILLLE